MSTFLEKNISSYLFGSNAAYVEELYEAYLANPNSVEEYWRDYFDQLQDQPATDGKAETRDQNHSSVIASFVQRARENRLAVKADSQLSMEMAGKQLKVQQLIAAYRSLGLRYAQLDPLKRTERPEIPELDPAFYGLTEADLDETFSATNTYFTKNEHMTLRELIEALRNTYCRSVGVEYMHISDPKAKRWIQERVESSQSSALLTDAEKKAIRHMSGAFRPILLICPCPRF